MLKRNRAAPDAAVIPVLYYPDVRKAVEWLMATRTPPPFDSDPADWGGELLGE